ncbi:Coronin-like protein crn1 [Polyrhizophydium stewartii]|uniref:Coronin n=1 Tax=Polyrhizophydium stewartii TaxID=2732419 RepID=A0ABR4MYV8_9FUNG
MSRFVRASKYRHVFGTANKRDQCYDNLKVTRSAWDTNLVTANPLFISVNLEASGGGAFTVIPHATTGKLPDNLPVFNGHSAAVLDTDFNPFNDHIVASASEDTKAMIWRIPEGGLTENVSTPTVSLAGHGRKVGHVLFNPVADNILATSSADFLVKIWDISTGQEKMELAGHADIVQSISWNWTGNLLVTTAKDKKLRVYDVRAKSAVQEAACHQGVKGARALWMGNSANIVTTGFSRSSDRQVFIWDSANLASPLKQEQIDTASGMLIPYFDADTNMLFLAGKGDGNIRYYEWTDDDKGLFPLSEYKSSDPLRGIGFLPKRACAINEVEIARAYKVHPTLIEPISFKVPRKSDAFQSDLFPDTIGPDPTMSAADWLAGKTQAPKLINLEKGFVPAAPKEFVTSAPASVDPTPTTGAPPMTEKEYQDAYHSLRKENDELKSVLAQRDARVRQLEAQLEGLLKERS